jgi:starch phosphorylase
MGLFQTFQVYPTIPPALAFLETLSRNYWWSWQRDAVDLFRRIDPRLWATSNENPLVFLTRVSQNRLEDLARDMSFMSHLNQVRDRFEKRVLAPVENSSPPLGPDNCVAYFSMEFGIHESLPLYSGGLGILAGDHLKAASAVALPLVGVGLLYRQGYFHQYLDQNGWQQETYPETDLYTIPLRHAKVNGENIRLSVAGPDGEILATVWRVMIGRIPLFLLDTNLPENSPAVRDLTARLYPGDGKIRLAQEALLGIGGMQALAIMGITPAVCHMNEGHSAFAGVERLVQTISRCGVDLETALEIVPRTTVFTTHTPVAAGHDEFPIELVRPVLRPLAHRLELPEDQVLAWGQAAGTGPNAPLSMFVLAIRMSQYCNGVSHLHGQVARHMWSHIWPDRPEDEIPITHITNGVHIPSWLSSGISTLFDRYLGPDWSLPPRDPANINRIDEIFEEELWRTHEMSRTRLVRTCRELVVKQYRRRNAPMAVIREAESVLDPGILTIGFARRFATYKRANLLLQDANRLEALLTSEKQPIQIIFAGKAHPKDNEGKALIKRLIDFCHRPAVRNRVVFLEDYDPWIARQMLQGVDVWLNTPRRPFEACGTSGMKAAVNGGLNVSILDGWWCEGYAENRGWRIGDGEDFDDPGYQDTIESQALYNVLENDVIPTFYEKDEGDIPMRWVRMMKEAMKMVMRDFSALRMIQNYQHRFYLPAARRLGELLADDAHEARALARQRERLVSRWGKVVVEPPERAAAHPFRVGEQFQITAVVNLGELQPEEVAVELYYGPFKSVDALANSFTQRMEMTACYEQGRYLYACSIACRIAGRYGFTVRVSPLADDWVKFTPGLLTWA